MCRVDFDRVVELQQFSVKAVVKHPGHLLRRVSLGADKVRTPNIAYEKGVASEHFQGFLGDFSINDENRNTFRRMAWRLHNAKDQLPYPDLLAFPGRPVRKRRAGVRAKDYLSSCA